MKKFPSNFVKRKINLLCFDTNSTFDEFYVKDTLFFYLIKQNYDCEIREHFARFLLFFTSLTNFV